MRSSSHSPTNNKIGAAFARSQKALELKPALGLGTGVSVSRIIDGLACEIREGNWTFRADMPSSAGGEGSAPTPGVYGRAALGSCLAIAYMMRAAANSVPIHSLEVEVQAHYDDGALFGTSDVRPGYTKLKYIVRIVSDSPEKDIMDLLDDADRHSPYLDVFSNPLECIREVEIETAEKL